MQIAHAYYPEYSASIRRKYCSNLALATLTFGRVLLYTSRYLQAFRNRPASCVGMATIDENQPPHF